LGLYFFDGIFLGEIKREIEWTYGREGVGRVAATIWGKEERERRGTIMVRFFIRR